MSAADGTPNSGRVCADLPGSGLNSPTRSVLLRVWPDQRPPTFGELAELAHDAEGILCINGDPITSELLAKCPSIRMVAVAGSGYDSVKLGPATVRLITVTHTPGVVHGVTADLAFAPLAQRWLTLPQRTSWVYLAGQPLSSPVVQTSHNSVSITSLPDVTLDSLGQQSCLAHALKGRLKITVLDGSYLAGLPMYFAVTCCGTLNQHEQL